VVDELRAALELASDEELQELTQILFQPKFNPLDYVTIPKPIEVQSYDRETWIYTLEQRFRFLAADGFTVLRGRTEQVDYRQVLIKTCQQLKISYSQSFTTIELESEIFLTLLQKACKELPPQQYKALNQEIQKSLTQSSSYQQLPVAVQQDPLRLVLTGGGALAVSSVLRPWLLQQISRQITLHLARCLAAKELLAKGGTLAAQIESRALLQVAGQEVALNAARYGAVRSVFAFLGPLLWTWFLADLGWRAIATNYSRTVPAIFTLAQIRLTRA
jgi:uncharacterized protein YaaW (UPF0174 family)